MKNNLNKIRVLHGPSAIIVFLAPIINESQPIMHIIAQEAYGDPRFVYHVAGPPSESQ